MNNGTVLELDGDSLGIELHEKTMVYKETKWRNNLGVSGADLISRCIGCHDPPAISPCHSKSEWRVSCHWRSVLRRIGDVPLSLKHYFRI
jgi:hypothetical protein